MLLTTTGPAQLYGSVTSTRISTSTYWGPQPSLDSITSPKSDVPRLTRESGHAAEWADRSAPFIRHTHWLVSTTLNRACPDSIRSNPLEASDIGTVSIRGRTPLRAENRSVSSESCDVPDGCPAIDRL